MIEMEIEGEAYPLIVDLGYFAQMTLDDEILQKVNKKPYGISQFKDFKNNHYESKNHLVPEIKIGNFSFIEVVVEEQNEAFEKNIVIRKSTKKPSKRRGTIGRALLKRKNILLDFPHSRLALIDNDNHQIGYPIENMLKVPFEMTFSGVVLNIETDLGEKKFLVDTGTTGIVIRSSLCNAEECQKDFDELNYFTSSQFVIGGKNFGEMPLYLLDIRPLA